MCIKNLKGQETMLKKMFVMTATLLLAAVAANADVTYGPTIYGASNSVGVPIIDGTWALILDVTGDGWKGHSYTAQAPAGAGNSASWLWDSNDVLLEKGVVGDSTDPNAYPGDITSAFVNVSAIANGQPSEVVVPGFVANVSHAYLIWSPVSENATAPGVGAQYGVMDVGVAAHDGDVLSPIIDTSVPGFESAANATFLTTAPVPEPTTLLLLAVGGGVAAAIRRRRRTVA
jgi:hypothetical protein